MYDKLSLLSGKLLQAGIASIRVIDDAGNEWKADIFDRPDGSRSWFVGTIETVRTYTIEALDQMGKVLSSFNVPNH